MSIEYTIATPDMLDLLVSTRIEVLRAANRLDDSADMSRVAAQSRADRFAGAGGVSYYRVMPTFHNPSGRCAYIMNMYVRPDYRRRGIATAILDLLVTDARERGAGRIALEATEAGRPLYEKYGFVPALSEMALP